MRGQGHMALLRLGPASGYQVAKESGVPRSTVYEVLAKLGTRLL
jgi:sugar-specific transcriptional regulator TrmB